MRTLRLTPAGSGNTLPLYPARSADADVMQRWIAASDIDAACAGGIQRGAGSRRGAPTWTKTKLGC